MEEKNTGIVWPLLFSLELPVKGNGFLAGVAIDGNLLATKEEEGVWVDGIQPGFLGEGDTDIRSAYLKFRKAIKEILEGIAKDSKSFSQFEEEATRFFDAKDREVFERWESAVREVRAGAITAPEALHTRKADSADLGIQIVNVAGWADDKGQLTGSAPQNDSEELAEDRTICRLAA